MLCPIAEPACAVLAKALFGPWLLAIDAQYVCLEAS